MVTAYSVGSLEWDKTLSEIHEISKHTPNSKTDWQRLPQWDMANAHYTFLTAIAQAYKHAESAPSSDAVNYLTFVRAIASSINVHHETEESHYFPALEKSGKLKMANSIEQHTTFHDGIQALESYLNQQIEKAKAGSTEDAIDPTQIRKMIDDFAGPLCHHLRDELDALDPAAVKEAFTKTEVDEIMKNVLNEIIKHDMSEFMPLCLTNCATDNDSTWPPIPWPVRYVVGPLVIGWKTMPLWKYSAHSAYAKFPW